MSELAQEVLDAAHKALILQSRSIAQSWLFEPEIGEYVYRVNWTFEQGYSVQRRSKHKDADKERLWDRNGATQNWIQLAGGMFDRAYMSRPIMFLDSMAKAHVIILDEVKKSVSAAEKVAA